MKEFSDLYTKLHEQCSYYSRHLGHLKALIDNDDWVRVVDDSMSGRVLLLGKSEIENALVLFNTRIFDTGKDAITVHKLRSNLPKIEDIETYHLARMKEIGTVNSVDRYFLVRDQFIEAAKKLGKKKTIEKLRLLRHHILAHNINEKPNLDNATLSELLELTESVIELVDLAGFIVTSSWGIYQNFSRRAEKETRMLLAALPALSVAERELNC